MPQWLLFNKGTTPASQRHACLPFSLGQALLLRKPQGPHPTVPHTRKQSPLGKASWADRTTPSPWVPHDTPFGRSHWREAPIITNLLDLEAISWKQTEETSLALKHRNQKKTIMAAHYFQAASKAGTDLVGKKGVHCPRVPSTQQKGSAQHFPTDPVTLMLPRNHRLGHSTSQSPPTPSVPRSLISRGLKIQLDSPLTWEIRRGILRNALKPTS